MASEIKWINSFEEYKVSNHDCGRKIYVLAHIFNEMFHGNEEFVLNDLYHN